MNEEITSGADIEENIILHLDKNILEILLQDKTTKKNIIWATDDYADLGPEYASDKEIAIELITGEHGGVIKPRSVKTREEQAIRVRNMAEVFTPTWICNKQANLTDYGWFVENKGFNIEGANTWKVNEGKVIFVNKAKDVANGWIHYLSRKCLEITCGEAPYLVSRYDAVTGDLIPLYSRIGLLDRKMRIINEKIRNFKDKNKSKKRWLILAKRALHSTYGFDWSGDNVLLARENILATVREYYKDKFKEELDIFNLENFAEIIAWNIWQMDGLKCVVPNSCQDTVRKIEIELSSLFDEKKFTSKRLSKSKSYCDVSENELEKCQGCLKDNLYLHNGIYCKIKNWTTGKKYIFRDLVGDQRGMFSMSKDFKFDVIIGNPPYQIEDQGSGKSAKPVYQYYVDSARKLSPQYMSMIMPSRWFTGGKGLKDFRASMLTDKHLCKLVDYENFRDVFPDVDLAGGACFFLWKSDHDGKCEVVNASKNFEDSMERNLDEYEIFVRSNKSLKILRKIIKKNADKKTLASVVSSRKPFGLPTNYEPVDAGVPCWFIQRIGRRFANPDDIDDSMGFLDKWKLIAPKSPIAGQTDFTKPVGFYYDGNTKIAKPGECCTESFLILGAFNTEKEVLSYKSYIFTKIVRFLILQTVVSQDVTKKNYCFVPDLEVYDKTYTDKILKDMWEITDDEWNYIDSRIGYSHECK